VQSRGTDDGRSKAQIHGRRDQAADGVSEPAALIDQEGDDNAPPRDLQT
jgi:hypothetical protein